MSSATFLLSDLQRFSGRDDRERRAEARSRARTPRDGDATSCGPLSSVVPTLPARSMVRSLLARTVAFRAGRSVSEYRTVSRTSRGTHESCDPARHRSRGCGCPGRPWSSWRSSPTQGLVLGAGVDQGEELGLARQAIDPVGAVGPGAGGEEGLGQRVDVLRSPGAPRGSCRSGPGGRTTRSCRRRAWRISSQTPTWTLTPASGRPRSSTSRPRTVAGRSKARSTWIGSP